MSLTASGKRVHVLDFFEKRAGLLSRLDLRQLLNPVDTVKLDFMAPDLEKLKKVKMLILDVDGVMTDCRIFLGSDGEWKRMFSILDGVGIKRLQEHGYKTAVITGSKAKDIQARVKVLGIDYFFEGSMNKEPSFQKLQQDSGLSPSEMAYVGDDFFDIPLLKQVAFSATVPGAIEEVKNMVDYTTVRSGGNGAVREVCDLIFQYGALSQVKGAKA